MKANKIMKGSWQSCKEEMFAAAYRLLMGKIKKPPCTNTILMVNGIKFRE